RLDDGWQAVAPQMRPIIIQDRWFALARCQDLQDSKNVGTTRSRGQLTVAEGTGSSLAKKITAFPAEVYSLIKCLHLSDAVANRTTTLQHDGLTALLGKQVRGRQTSWSGADNNRSPAQGMTSGRRQFKRRLGEFFYILRSSRLFPR